MGRKAEAIAEALKQAEKARDKFDVRVHEHALRHIDVEHVRAAVDELKSEMAKSDAPTIDDDDADEFLNHFFQIMAQLQPHIARPKQKIPESKTGFRWSH